MSPEEKNHQLEKFVHDSLRTAPVRRAPRNLELRVLSEIARREALPWYRRSIAYWPTAARVGFLVLSAAIGACVIMAGIEVMRLGSGAGVGSWLTHLSALRSNAVAAGNTIAGLFPAHTFTWALVALGAVAFLYAVILAAGATAYRLLWKSR